jgi:predicted pyridoxine 5'-phosphate oxidase superfamily flavin-nucleotide-binding protein
MTALDVPAIDLSGTDALFSPAVREAQARRGSRHAYERFEARGGFRDVVTPELAAFVEARDSFFLATASAQGQPYIQHRGGPPGFLRVQDERTLAFADYRGNRQYVSVGNLAENDRVFLFLIDYRTQSRIKLWGRARVVEDDAALIARLMPPDYDARAERAVVITLAGWDANCPQHIPRMYDEAEVARLVTPA